MEIWMLPITWHLLNLHVSLTLSPHTHTISHIIGKSDQLLWQKLFKKLRTLILHSIKIENIY